jgi:hypothetical protein
VEATVQTGALMLIDRAKIAGATGACLRDQVERFLDEIPCAYVLIRRVAGNVSNIEEAELQLTAGIGAAAYTAFVRETPGPHADWHEIDAVVQDTWSRIGAAVAKHLI